MFNWFRKREPLYVRARQGKNGRWRWFARGKHGAFRCSGPPHGFPSHLNAMTHARNTLALKWTYIDDGDEE